MAPSVNTCPRQVLRATKKLEQELETMSCAMSQDQRVFDGERQQWAQWPAQIQSMQSYTRQIVSKLTIERERRVAAETALADGSDTAVLRHNTIQGCELGLRIAELSMVRLHVSRTCRNVELRN